MQLIRVYSFALLLAVAGFASSCDKRGAAPEGEASIESKAPEDYPESALGWKLGAQAYTFRLFTFFQAIDKIDSCGLKYVEAYPSQEIGGGIEGKMSFNMDAATRASVLEKLKEKGIVLDSYGVVNPDNEADWKQLFEFGKAMGIKTFTSEPAEEFLPLISKLCDEYGIRLAIHNHPTPRHYWNPEAVLSAIDGQSELVGACADIGHWVRSGLDPIDCLKKLEGHIFHLHMKDLNHKDGKDEGAEDRDVPWGTGVANTDGVIAELKRQNFKGMIAAEYERHWENNVPYVIQSVEYFRSALQNTR